MAKIIKFAPANRAFVPENLLDICKGLQEGIAAAPPDEQDAAGDEARRIIGPDVSYKGANRLEIRTLSAFALPDGLSFEEQVFPVVQFNEMRLMGHLSQVAYARVNAIRTLAWMIVDPKIREAAPSFIDEPGDPGAEQQIHAIGVANDTLRRPLYLPVGMIESVMVAAR